MKTLNRENFAARTHVPHMEKVDVTEWGDIDPETGKPEPTCVYVREITVAERGKFEAKMTIGKGKKTKLTTEKWEVWAVILACCDEYGNPLFQQSDEYWLEQKPCAMIHRIWKVFGKINNFKNEDEDEDETLKN